MPLLPSSASFPSLAVQISCPHEEVKPQRKECRENHATAAFLCVLPISCGSNFLPARRRRTAEEGSAQRKPRHRCLPLRPSHLLRFKFPAGTKKENRRGRKYAEKTMPPLPSSASFPSLAVQISCRHEGVKPQRKEVRRENHATAAFLCVLPISCGSNFLPARRRRTAEEGSTQRKPCHRCLPLRPSHLLRFKFPAGTKKENRRGRKCAEKTMPPLPCSASFPSLAVQISCRHEEGEPQRTEVRRENHATAAFLCVLPISCGSNFLPGVKEKNRRGRKCAEKTEPPLPSSASFPSLAVQISCRA